MHRDTWTLPIDDITGVPIRRSAERSQYLPERGIRSRCSPSRSRSQSRSAARKIRPRSSPRRQHMTGNEGSTMNDSWMGGAFATQNPSCRAIIRTSTTRPTEVDHISIAGKQRAQKYLLTANSWSYMGEKQIWRQQLTSTIPILEPLNGKGIRISPSAQGFWQECNKLARIGDARTQFSTH